LAAARGRETHVPKRFAKESPNPFLHDPAQPSSFNLMNSRWTTMKALSVAAGQKIRAQGGFLAEGLSIFRRQA